MDRKQDSIYIDRVLQGDRDAYAYLVKKYQAMVFSIALRMLKRREDAEEVAQDAFVKAFQSLGSFRGSSKFSTWLYRIVYNTCISRLRKNEPVHVGVEKVDLSGDLFDDGLKSYASLADSERKVYLEKALEKLDEEERFLVILYYYDDKELDEIAGITGQTKNNVKVRLFRARKKMLEYLRIYLREETYSLL